MSFLDNLENNLKALESRDAQTEDASRRRRERESERANAAAAAPFAEALKRGPYTAELLRQAARMGHAMRTKVHIAWLGPVLRLEARERRLELRPTGTGVIAVETENGNETRRHPVDLEGNPEGLLKEWLR